ncbi:MAG: hypothetical protein HY870_23760 [Chloroflexi bacterium]|nr:hypothetical protein [Chloroflexota bacterium]
MNRIQLLREAWAILKRNPVLWSVTLITLAIDAVVSWVVILAPPEAVLLRSVVAFGFAAFMTGALINLVNLIADGQPVTLIEGVQAGLRRLFPLLALNVILFLPAWFAIFVLSGSIYTIFSSGLGQPGSFQATDVLSLMGAMLGAAGLVVAINAVTNLIGIGAERTLVLEGAPIITALKSGWQLLLSHSREYLSIGIMLVGLVLTLSLAFAFIVGPLLSGLASGFSQAPEATTPAPVFSPVNVIFIFISLVVNSLYAAFASSVWTLAFRKWQGK